MKTIIRLLILILQLGGAIQVGIGLTIMWEPLGWIYSGIIAFMLGHLVYLDAKTEESES